jgi:hypothetical protein
MSGRVMVGKTERESRKREREREMRIEEGEVLSEENLVFQFVYCLKQGCHMALLCC